MNETGFSSSPLHSAPRLAQHLGIRKIWIKRDDLLGFAGGGTKCRKLPALMRRLQLVGADTLLVSGGAYSNQARLIAAVAAASNRSCEVFLDGPEDAPAAHFARLFGGLVHALPGSTHWTLNSAIRARMRELGAAGKRVFVVPAAAADDLASYEEALKEVADCRSGSGDLTIVTAAGSGATSAGFLMGLERFLPGARLLSISVDRAALELRTVVTRLLATSHGASADGSIVNRLISRLTVDDRFVGSGYGIPSTASLDAVALAARTEGLLMEPVYTGKALAALFALTAEGSVSRDDEVIFWHTGGVAYLMAALEQSNPPKPGTPTQFD